MGSLLHSAPHSPKGRKPTLVHFSRHDMVFWLR